jgi:hypothetical protein
MTLNVVLKEHVFEAIKLISDRNEYVDRLFIVFG